MRITRILDLTEMQPTKYTEHWTSAARHIFIGRCVQKKNPSADYSFKFVFTCIQKIASSCGAQFGQVRVIKGRAEGEILFFNSIHLQVIVVVVCL